MGYLVFVDGQIISADEARVAVDDRAFLYGDGLFETVRVYSSLCFRLEAHIDRLYASCDALAIEPPMSADMLAVSARQLVDANSVHDGVLRLRISRGRGAGPRIPDGARPSVMITASSGGLYPAGIYERGLRLVTASFPRNERSPLARHKTHNYLESVLARREAVAVGADEAMMLNTCGRVAECAAANIFIVTGGTVVTPPVSEGPLPGVARAEVIRLCGEEDMDLCERPVEASEVASCDEAFVTNSVIEICSVAEIDGQAVGPGAPGKVTGRLREAYTDAVASSHRPRR